MGLKDFKAACNILGIPVQLQEWGWWDDKSEPDRNGPQESSENR